MRGILFFVPFFLQKAQTSLRRPSVTLQKGKTSLRQPSVSFLMVK